ncbi:MAG: hypothetical protein R3D55_25895 [Chloroflexota bacterium]
MKPLKTSDLHPCDACGGSIVPFFYRLTVSFRQLAIDRTAVNGVLGTAQIFGGNLRMGELMSPNQDATFELPGYQVDKGIFLCQDCVMGMNGEPFVIRPLDWMIESEEDENEETI